jgi:hypothetical protein
MGGRGFRALKARRKVEERGFRRKIEKYAV